jgi:precorrin-2 dehydrogenase / sirohydrochlorin ferrochelatase
MARTGADRGVPYYPAFLDLVGKRVVVVGGGRVATDKIHGLLPCRPRPPVVIAPQASEPIRRLVAQGRLQWHQRPYRQGDLADADLVFAATDDRALNAVVAGEARARGVPVLAVDDVPNCDFIAPALVRRRDLTIAISTHGRSPAMARFVRAWLDAVVPAHWGRLLDVAATARDRLGARRALVAPDAWQAALDARLDALVEADALEAATTLLVERLAPEPVGER